MPTGDDNNASGKLGALDRAGTPRAASRRRRGLLALCQQSNCTRALVCSNRNGANFTFCLQANSKTIRFHLGQMLYAAGNLTLVLSMKERVFLVLQ